MRSFAFASICVWKTCSTDSIFIGLLNVAPVDLVDGALVHIVGIKALLRVLITVRFIEATPAPGRLLQLIVID